MSPEEVVPQCPQCESQLIALASPKPKTWECIACQNQWTP